MLDLNITPVSLAWTAEEQTQAEASEVTHTLSHSLASRRMLVAALPCRMSTGVSGRCPPLHDRLGPEGGKQTRPLKS